MSIPDLRGRHICFTISLMRNAVLAALACIFGSAIAGCGNSAPTPVTCPASGGYELNGLLTTIPLPASGGITGAITLPPVVGGLTGGLSLTVNAATPPSGAVASWTLTLRGVGQQMVLTYPPSVALVLPPGIQPSSLSAYFGKTGSQSPAVLQPKGWGRFVTFTASGTYFAIVACGSTSELTIVRNVAPSQSPSASPPPTTPPSTPPTSPPTATPPTPTPSPPANVYIANCGDVCGGPGPTGVKAFDPQGNPVTLAGTFPGITAANAITFASSVSRLYVADCGGCYNIGATTVLAFNLDGTPVALAPGAFGGLVQPGITFVPANGELYVSDFQEDTVFVFDTSGNKITASGGFPGLHGPFAMTYVPDNNLLYVANFTAPSSIATFDLQGHAVPVRPGSFTDLTSPRGMTYAPDVHQIYVTTNNPSAVVAYDIDGNQVPLPGNFPGLEIPIAIAYDPDTNLLYVTNQNGAITVYYLDGTPASTGSWTGASVPVGVTITP